ncbi:hypothetical protein WME89_27380 [Sorangium sp. So ce321]|uniref:OB-fold protein n=1 Tax=Sorangium sp. So ce321 TaxID=3133300 RepID=UPI003F62E258
MSTQDQGAGPHPHGHGRAPHRKRPIWLYIVGGFLVIAVLSGLLRGKDRRAASSALPPAALPPASAPVNPTVKAEPPRPRAPELPPEPAPSEARLASEVPALEAKLAANRVYVTVWDPARSAERTLLLSAVSQTLSAGGFYGLVMTALKTKKEIEDAAVQLFLIHVRIGRYPDDFSTQLKAHLDAVKGEPRLGVWNPYSKGQVPHDYAALAAWVHRDQPAYIRELLAARKGGPVSWSRPEVLDRPYLSDEAAALEWLARLDTLQPAEQARLEALRAEAKIVRVPIQKLLAEYKDNEVRADEQFKGKVIQTTGVAVGIEKDFLDHIIVRVGSGRALDMTTAWFYIGDQSAKAASALSKGSKVTIRGRVDGLTLGNVICRNAEIVP